MSNLKALLTAILLSGPAVAETPLVGLDRIEKASPWTAVGRLEIGQSGFCTASLIAPDLVLTAAHCTYDTDGPALRPQALLFRAGFREGRVAAERKVVQIARPDSYSYTDDSSAVRIANDVALLRLHQPIATHVIAPFVVETRAVSDGPVSVVSYGRGRETLPSLQQTCHVKASFRGVVAMDCNTTFGSSGAPVFRRDGERVRIASIVSGAAQVNGEQLTVGMALPVLVASLKAKLIAEGAPPVANVRRIGVGGRTSGGAKFIRPGGS